MTDEELIARLRGDDTDFWHCEAADRIEALVKESAEWATLAADYNDKFDAQRKRAERLEAAASSVADDVCSYICPSVGRAGEPILHDPRCIALRAALKEPTMSDNDLIRRGDALAAVQAAYDDSGFEPDLADADARIAALPAVTVGVKPLVWEAGERDQRRADSILGEFCVTFFGGRWFYQGEPRKGMLDAQAAAQAGYEARILAALDLTPAPDAQAVRDAALREAAEVALRHRSKVQINEMLWHEGQDWAAERIAEAILALIGKEGE